jgi:cohesin complex subunit SCC1
MSFLFPAKQQEEMLANETVEQFEERVRNKRSNVLLRYLSNQLEDEDEGVTLSVIVANNNRKQVAQKFYSLLVLKKQQAIELYQDLDQEYGEITVTRGIRYDEALASCA